MYLPCHFAFVICQVGWSVGWGPFRPFSDRYTEVERTGHFFMANFSLMWLANMHLNTFMSLYSPLSTLLLFSYAEPHCNTHLAINYDSPD
jgi:hypothetical protein